MSQTRIGPIQLAKSDVGSSTTEFHGALDGEEGCAKLDSTEASSSGRGECVRLHVKDRYCLPIRLEPGVLLAFTDVLFS